MTRDSFDTGWEARAAAAPFDGLRDEAVAFRPVTLPHDAMIKRERDPSAPDGAKSGYFPGGVHEYRKVLLAPVSWQGKRIVVEFEGVYRDAMVYVNGDLAGQRPSGYTGFAVRIDPFLRYGQENVIRVEARSHRDSRWYSGTGIIRPTWLVVTDLLHVPGGGIRVTTPDVTADGAVVEVATRVVNAGSAPRRVEVATCIRDARGRPIGQDRSHATVPPAEDAVVRHRIHVPDPPLWSPARPELCSVDTVLLEDATVLEKRRTPIGIRSLQLDPAHGLRINGERTRSATRSPRLRPGSAPLGPGASPKRSALSTAPGSSRTRSTASSPCSMTSCQAGTRARRTSTRRWPASARR